MDLKNQISFTQSKHVCKGSEGYYKWAYYSVSAGINLNSQNKVYRPSCLTTLRRNPYTVPFRRYFKMGTDEFNLYVNMGGGISSRSLWGGVTGNIYGRFHDLFYNVFSNLDIGQTNICCYKADINNGFLTNHPSCCTSWRGNIFNHCIL